MSASSHYAKIALTKQELTQVYQQFVDAAQEKYKQHLPEAGHNDPLQIEVENLVNETFIEVFEMAKWALVVDGHDFSGDDVSIKDVLKLSPTEEVMPFDTQLNQKLRSIIQEVENETTEVTRLRRELPERAKDAYESLITTTDEEVTSLIKELNEKYETSLEDEIHPELAETIPSAKDLLSDYEESIERLAALKSGLPQEFAQVEAWSNTIGFLEESQRQQQAENRLL